jgi:arginine/lysine/histidine transport system permease protein
MAWLHVLAEKLQAWFAEFRDEFVVNFITDSRWTWLAKGLRNTLRITAVAILLGVVIGVVVATVRASYDKNREMMALHGGFSYRIFAFFNGVCRVYLAIIRGTPVVVQLLIMYFIIFARSRNAIMVATLAFGVNSGAYVAEIIRGGIMSIDNGQFEAGRSLGFNYVQTMLYIVIPQVFKSVLPALLNEFIALLKETSVAGYVGIMDLTKAGDLIRGRTFSAFMPLIAVALVYLAIVMLLTSLVSRLERRLRKSER